MSYQYPISYAMSYLSISYPMSYLSIYILSYVLSVSYPMSYQYPILCPICILSYVLPILCPVLCSIYLYPILCPIYLLTIDDSDFDSVPVSVPVTQPHCKERLLLSLLSDGRSFSCAQVGSRS